MKMIVAIKRACRRPRSLIRHCLLARGRNAREVEGLRDDGHRVVAITNGMQAGAVTTPAVTSRLLCGDVPEGRAPLRHVVISAEDMKGVADRANAFAALSEVVGQWLAAFAPSSPYLAIAHDDMAHPHVHLLLANCDPLNDDARLAWSPATVSAMQSLSFVSAETKHQFALESGRHSGATRREGSGLPYPRADLSARKLAKMSDKEIENYEYTGNLTIARRNKLGEITTIIFENRRIRLSTIRQLVEVEKHTRSTAFRNDPDRQWSKRFRRPAPIYRNHARYRARAHLDLA
jgi:hypothetical protein